MFSFPFKKIAFFCIISSKIITFKKDMINCCCYLGPRKSNFWCWRLWKSNSIVRGREKVIWVGSRRKVKSTTLLLTRLLDLVSKMFSSVSFCYNNRFSLYQLFKTIYNDKNVLWDIKKWNKFWMLSVRPIFGCVFQLSFIINIF